MKSLLTYYQFILHISALVGSLYLFKLKGDYFRYFALYLIGILLLDYYFIGFYKLLTDDRDLWPVYSKCYTNYLQIPFQYLFLSWLYYKRNETSRKTILIGTGIYIVIWIIEGIDRFGTGYEEFFTYSYQVGALWMMVLSFLYFINLMTSDRIIDFYKERFFYVSLGILIFYVLSMPFHVFEKVFRESENHFIQNMYSNFSYPLNIIMYLLFALSFIWGRRN